MNTLSEKQRETLLCKYPEHFFSEPFVVYRRQPYYRLYGRGVIPDIIFRTKKTFVVI